MWRVWPISAPSCSPNISISNEMTIRQADAQGAKRGTTSHPLRVTDKREASRENCFRLPGFLEEATSRTTHIGTTTIVTVDTMIGEAAPDDDEDDPRQNRTDQRHIVNAGFTGNREVEDANHQENG